jgi:hypothetical protein
MMELVVMAERRLLLALFLMTTVIALRHRRRGNFPSRVSGGTGQQYFLHWIYYSAVINKR